MSNHILIIYTSKTGFTRTYAQWLQQDLHCDCVEYAQRHTVDLAKYQAVAFGGALYVGKINGLKWFKKQLPRLRGKRAAVFFVGAMPPDPADIRRVERENFQPEELSFIKPFYLQGGLRYGAMNPVDRLLMAVFKKMLKNKANAPGGSPKEKIMLQNIQHDFDQTQRDSLKPLEAYLTEEPSR